MSVSPIVFSATGKIQCFVAPVTGSYVIEAAGAQGGAGGGPGGRGARLKGLFFLGEGDVLQILVGQQGTAGSTAQQPAGGGGGGSFVWRCSVASLLPSEPLLAAGGGGGGCGGDGLASIHGGKGAAPGGRHGHGGKTDRENLHYSGGGGAGWLSDGESGSTPTICGGGALFRGGAGANYCLNIGGSGGFGGGGGGAFNGRGSGGGGGYSGGGGGTQAGPGGGGGGSFNAGAFQTNYSGAQSGDGCVSITLVPSPAAWPATDSAEPFATANLTDESVGAPDSSQWSEGELEGKGYM